VSGTKGALGWVESAHPSKHPGAVQPRPAGESIAISYQFRSGLSYAPVPPFASPPVGEG